VIAVLLPLIALMPLLHAHPLGAVSADHPVGVHVPTQFSVATTDPGDVTGAGGGVGVESALAPQMLPTIVVEDGRSRAAADTGHGFTFDAIAQACWRADSIACGPAALSRVAEHPREHSSAPYRSRAPPRREGLALI
jgi:hypothetical protein